MNPTEDVVFVAFVAFVFMTILIVPFCAVVEFDPGPPTVTTSVFVADAVSKAGVVAVVGSGFAVLVLDSDVVVVVVGSKVVLALVDDASGRGTAITAVTKTMATAKTVTDCIRMAMYV